MKARHITTLIAIISAAAFAHEGVELGPNGGRILEFSKDETMHGEVIVKGGKFHIALLDKDMKPVAMDKQSLTAITGDRSAPQKLTVEKDAKGFVVPLVKAGEWLILQYKNAPDTKAITARMEYNTATCEACKEPEWLCKCKPDKDNK
jgi:hypothetical protein